MVHIRLAYAGSATEGEAVIAPLRQIVPLACDTVEEFSYTRSGRVHHDPPGPIAYFSTTAMLSGLDGPTIDRVLTVLGGRGDNHCVVEFRHLGGALAREPRVPNAIGGRSAHFLLNVISVLDRCREPVEPLHRRIIEAVAHHRIGTNLNFLSSGFATERDVKEAYDPTTYRRLARLKFEIDPDNWFRHNHNIPPARKAGRLPC